jgi:hypothetical protein
MVRTTVTASIAVSFLIVPVSAQSQDEPPRGNSLFSQGGVSLIGVQPTLYSPIVLLKLPPVQEELDLTKAQKAQLEKGLERQDRERSRLKEEMNKRMKEQLGDQPDGKSIVAFRLGARRAMDAFHEETKASLLEILDRHQLTRLVQIQYQAEGFTVFTRPEIQERLNLAAEQVEEILAIVAEGSREISNSSILPPEVVPQGRTPEKRRVELESKTYKEAAVKAREAAVKSCGETMRRIAKVFTKGQRANFEKLVGEPFDFTKLWGTATPTAVPESKGTKP